MPKQTWLRVRGPRELVAGLILSTLAGIAIWSLSGLSQGSLRVAGPAMFPRWVAVVIGLYGLSLIVSALLKDGPPLENYHVRNALLVSASIIIFALGIRSLGLILSTLAMVGVAGMAHPHLTLTEKTVLAIGLALSSTVLFRFLLGLPIPLLIIPGTSIAI